METSTLIASDLSKFDIGDYNAGTKWKIILWYPINYFIFNSSIPWPNMFKSWLLRLFGARIGTGLIIKPRVIIKNPQKLIIGDNCWLGESVWIDNLDKVTLGDNVCISQGAMLLTGNHDYSKMDFPYRLGAITLADGVWIGAKSVVCPGITCLSHAILTVNSVATKNLEPRKIYSGNPAVYLRDRKITN
ncbi:WcaF family extracellular polysaccharide biosynthesis acetyltransferase [Pedobacter sp. GR22-10]|uniref:WcaF family extracellular polysaccharide biosynthesis acetyltransferase n=1 Tax=Pedobacter sp. GR22-10 TaxID=2994472 RepID=UPI002246D770|nr:WcaF family extracellular polysaccharide biosynthesis acetyltransferase [Pedobacter sp. GR22-10]MCX2433204.1 WcaF family extracellular polysaccharide biosynthesis acetyltransferase [Pedobacter sp. GR22-10]